MNRLLDNSMALLLGLVSGALCSAVFLWFFAPWGNPSALEAAQETTRQPLYWVAPMDPNFKRDKPGKSPMGMDLVPALVAREDLGNGRLLDGRGLDVARGGDPGLDAGIKSEL